MRALLLALAVLASVPGVSRADETHPADALEWLKKVAAAAHQLNYSGTYIYQAGDYIETSKIIHIRDDSGEHEKLEALDGPAHEVIRNNDEVLCFRPDSDTSVVVEKRKMERSFPALLPRQMDGIAGSYRARFVKPDRTAGYACRVIVLEPRDRYRYRHKLWADHATGLLLKAITLNEKNEAIGQFAFTQIAIGGRISRELLKPKIAGRKVVVSSGPATATELRQDDLTWAVKQLPPGFSQVTVMKRTMPGKDVQVKHLVFSDGLATVSVFIEPVMDGVQSMQGAVHQGMINAYTRMATDHQITVLGEVPAVTVAQIANSTVNMAK